VWIVWRRVFTVAYIQLQPINHRYLCQTLSAALLIFVVLFCCLLKCSRASAVALSTVLWVVLRKYRNWPFSAAHRIKTLKPINTEISVIDYIIEVTKCAKYGQHRSSELVSPYGWSCLLTLYFLLFFSNIWLSGTRTADAGRSTPHIIYQSMRFGPRMCLLRVSTLRNYIWGVSPKTLPHFLAEIGIPSLNFESNNFRTARPILVIRSSNDASPQRNSNMWPNC
jgi:hypothetical protein